MIFVLLLHQFLKDLLELPAYLAGINLNTLDSQDHERISVCMISPPSRPT